MSRDFDEIIRRIPALSPGEVEQLRQRLAALSALGGSGNAVAGRAASQEGSDESLVLCILVDVLARLGVERTAIHTLRSQPSDLALFRRKLPDLLHFINSNAPHHLQRQALLGLGIELLYRDLVEQQIPISARVVMRHVHRIPAVLNRHLPGYAESGLLRHVIRMRKPANG